ncbi:phenylacetate-coenzyme A ligase PaaK-like adenylate-forming protein [Pedobacter cryoconitis]|uniref:Phenylacetate-coenzyme A ligase PaaK-like adenylate-forming protein n=1 Tax=Pedobacter cryoconitis TaxID=188932 RepID=A0A7W9E1P8_9SPHI|nr:acyl transferase [Pedobacter cryoconitis]MBB5639336.1 phenylacetate-coenzyme A ligase PaaK-like adenylate-forming protein [Pedobacter cryoconitis]
MKTLIPQIFSIRDDEQFNEAALAIFKYQAEFCVPYHQFITNLNIKADQITRVADIPYLPISFFKSHTVVSNTEKEEIIFSSSGTTGQIQSKHFVTDLKVYEDSFNKAFEQFYGKIEDTCLLALLPSYLERDGSSLIYMIDALLNQSKHPDSGYFLHNHEELFNKLNTLKAAGQKTILIGVTYALLDFLELYQVNFPELTVMETGGMKGKRKEMVREELHEILTSGFGVDAIHSEYGMTELLSQAYSSGNGVFDCPNWMKIVLRDTNDPLTLLNSNQTGGINIIDLANINSCSFIATQDLGRLLPGGSFEVLGRFDNADIRGCNLLVQ